MNVPTKSCPTEFRPRGSSFEDAQLPEESVTTALTKLTSRDVSSAG